MAGGPRIRDFPASQVIAQALLLFGVPWRARPTSEFAF